MKSLRDLFEDMLKDVYYAEGAILKALPKMIKAVEAPELKEAFQSHLEETKGQVGRLEQVFKIIGVKAEGKKCPVILGLVEECEGVIADAEDSEVRDAGVLACGQAVEHYEISRYGTLRAWAERLMLEDAVELLHETLEEEKEADEKLSELAYASINEEADMQDDSDADKKPMKHAAASQTKKASKSQSGTSARK